MTVARAEPGRSPAGSAPLPSSDRYCAAIVLYHPEGDLYLENVAAICEAGLAPIVFDNSEDAEARNRIRMAMAARFGDSVTLLSEEGNIGLSAAYNRIIAHAESLGGMEAVDPARSGLHGSRAVDQQSHRDLRARAHPAGDGVLSGMAMRRDAIPYRVYQLGGGGNAGDSLIRVRMAPSSFSLIPLATIRTLGGFHDDFFIDHIDVDFCFRCHKRGMLVALDPSAPFPHVIGHGLVTILGYPVSPISSPFRHYYQVRNILLSAQRRGAPWFAAIWELAKRFAVIGVVGLSAGRVVNRYQFALRGLRDGLRNQGGKMPSGRA